MRRSAKGRAFAWQMLGKYVVTWLLALAVCGCGTQRPGDRKPGGIDSTPATESDPAADSESSPGPPGEAPPVAPPPGAEAPESDAGADETPACAEPPPQVCECPGGTGADAGIPNAEAGPRIIAAQLLTPLLSGENRTLRLAVYAMAARTQGAIRISCFRWWNPVLTVCEWPARKPRSRFWSREPRATTIQA